MLDYHILTLSFKSDGFASIIHPILIRTSDGIILFDVGYPNQQTEIETELQRLGFSINDIYMVIISHHDHDHIGSLSALLELNPKIKVLASRDEAEFISGKVKPARLMQAEKINESLVGMDKDHGEQFVKYLKTINQCKIDRIICGGEYITDGVKVIDTFGHSPGHISLYLENEEILLAGDSLAIENDTIVIANPQYTLNMHDAVESIKIIKDLKLRQIICYHGGRFDGNIKLQLDEMLKQQANRRST